MSVRTHRDGKKASGRITLPPTPASQRKQRRTATAHNCAHALALALLDAARLRPPSSFTSRDKDVDDLAMNTWGHL